MYVQISIQKMLVRIPKTFLSTPKLCGAAARLQATMRANIGQMVDRDAQLSTLDGARRAMDTRPAQNLGGG